ncbi:MAG: carboxylating nicotinate-nucleotide diphosphorylase [Bacteroidia bacterium]|nr:carboxylating nicotinate-nucleotide diphosphorylase [Bacteroidia bacterium]NNC86017.1 carboxylating nicotinate-nucleotide diphosphorylase [Bacteroidia bacterium]
MNTELLKKFVDEAILEDIKDGDHTSLACIPSTAKSGAKLLVKEDGIIAGIELAEFIFNQFDNSLELNFTNKDGDKVSVGDIAFTVHGKAQAILMAERLVLNCMQRMSGIASITNKYVEKIKGTNCKVLDTRKTTPHFRYLEKWAVRIGGGTNHRMGLYDMMMIKDNHIEYAGGIAKAIESANNYLRDKNLKLKIEIETRNLNEVEQVVSIGGVDRIMLDNFKPSNTQEAVKYINSRYETEASGGITLDTIRDYAETGVDYVSVGALTHSYKSMDLSLKAI